MRPPERTCSKRSHAHRTEGGGGDAHGHDVLLRVALQAAPRAVVSRQVPSVATRARSPRTHQGICRGVSRAHTRTPPRGAPSCGPRESATHAHAASTTTSTSSAGFMAEKVTRRTGRAPEPGRSRSSRSDRVTRRAGRRRAPRPCDGARSVRARRRAVASGAIASNGFLPGNAPATDTGL